MTVLKYLACPCDVCLLVDVLVSDGDGEHGPRLDADLHRPSDRHLVVVRAAHVLALKFIFGIYRKEGNLFNNLAQYTMH